MLKLRSLEINKTPQSHGSEDSSGDKLSYDDYGDGKRNVKVNTDCLRTNGKSESGT